jgi:preprotein translocase subunit SecE
MPVEERDKRMTKAVVISGTPENGQPRENVLTRGRTFLGEVRNEMRKVSSPTRAEVQSTTLVVIFAVFLFAAFFYVVDSVLGYVLQQVLHWLGGTGA